jgi:hypothetical protein
MSEWQPIQGRDDAWYGRYLVPNFASNSVAIAFGGDEHLIISPGKALLADFDRLFPNYGSGLGEGLHIVLPNAYHYMGLEAWLKSYPKARVYASKQATSALLKKGLGDLDCKLEVLEQADMGLPERARWVFPPGHRGGDAWLLLPHQDAWLWVVCDSFLNYPRVSNQPVARMMQKLLGAAPGLKISKVIKYFIMTDRSAFKGWVLDRLEEYPPSVLLPSHGDPDYGLNEGGSSSVSVDLAERLTQLVNQRL